MVKTGKVLGRLFMRGSSGIGTEIQDHPSPFEEHKAVDFRRENALDPLGKKRNKNAAQPVFSVGPSLAR